MSDRPHAQWRKRLASPLTWHYAGFAVLLVLVIGLAVGLGVDWASANHRSSGTLAGKQAELKALDLETVPLRGLDTRVEDSRTQLQAFYAERIPSSYSLIVTRIGELQVRSGVRISHVQYVQGKGGSDLTEIAMDAGISGDYPALMHFINSIERDPAFFVIRAMSLSGQQGGLVNLRVRLSTWLRPADAAASGIPLAAGAEEAQGGVSDTAKESK